MSNTEYIQPCHPALMNREQAIDYINHSVSPKDRANRKAEVFHIMYGNPQSFRDWMTQSLQSQPKGN
jgi:hypothetical protein